MKTHVNPQNPSALRAGFARRDITPTRPCFIVGYPHVERISTGIHDALLASVLCVENAGVHLVFISVDLIFVSAEWTRDCRQRIFTETGILPENILIAATHTHSGPHTAEIFAWKNDHVIPPLDLDYLNYASLRTAEAAIDAFNSLTPVDAGWTVADVHGLAGGNRIDPHAPEDPEACLFLFRHLENGRPMAILSIYGMHPTVLHEDSTLFSGDFIASTRRVIEDEFQGAGMVYLNGVCGNQSPRRTVQAQTFAEANRIGSALGRRMAEAIRKLSNFSSQWEVRAQTARIKINGKKFPSLASAHEKLQEIKKHYTALQTVGADRACMRGAECAVFGAEEVLTMAEAEVSGVADIVRKKYSEAEVQVFQMGEVFVAAWPGEFFVEYGLELKKQWPHPIFISTLSNGELQGYIVTPEAELAGGYEAQMSLFPASTGNDFVEETLGLLLTISGERK